MTLRTCDRAGEAPRRRRRATAHTHRERKAQGSSSSSSSGQEGVCACVVVLNRRAQAQPRRGTWNTDSVGPGSHTHPKHATASTNDLGRALLQAKGQAWPSARAPSFVARSLSLSLSLSRVCACVCVRERERTSGSHAHTHSLLVGASTEPSLGGARLQKAKGNKALSAPRGSSFFFYRRALEGPARSITALSEGRNLLTLGVAGVGEGTQVKGREGRH